jgi:DNA repair protein RadC
VDDRPRERLLARGSEALADRELLELLLGSGARGLDAVWSWQAN